MPDNTDNSQFNPDALESPKWLNENFITEVLRDHKREDFGKSLIIKTMSEEEGHKKDLIGSSPLFKTEVGMYSKVLPEFERILREAGAYTKLCANCIYHSLEPREILIFEDLMESGFHVLRNREVSIEEEVNRAYFKLAKWHAASLKLQAEQPHFLDVFTHGLLDMPQVTQAP